MPRQAAACRRGAMLRGAPPALDAWLAALVGIIVADVEVRRP